MKERYYDESDRERKLFADKAKRLAIYCYEHRLDGRECLQGVKVGMLHTFYNGIGPDFEWSVIVRIVDHMDLVFEPAAFIQDVQYHVAEDRSEENFHKVNRQFYDNCIKCAVHATSWWQLLKRHRLFKSAKVLFEECEKHGIDSWNKRGGK